MPKPPDGRATPPSDADRHEVDLILPMAAAICIALSWYVVLDYERAVLAVVPLVPALADRIASVRLMMSLLSVGGLGLAVLASRDARRRRRAERELRKANEALARRMERRTDALKSRAKALHESRVRERIKEQEAEVAFSAGQLEATGAYLHAVGNALSAFELALLRLGRTLDGAARLDAAFDVLLRDLESGDAAKARRHVTSLREAVLGRAVPRLAESASALSELKDRMVGELERHRGEFERYGKSAPFLHDIQVGEEVAAILDRMPRAAGSDPLVRELAPSIVIRNRKHPLLTGLAALLRQALDSATGPVVVRLEGEGNGRAALVVTGVPESALSGPVVAAFINFLNENNGALRFESGGPGQPSRLVIDIGSLS